MDDIKVKIEHSPDMSQDEAEDMLYKALSSARDGKTHAGEFDDPAMQDLVDLMVKLHDKTVEKILSEVFEVLDKEKF